jgi:hypothetical protein
MPAVFMIPQQKLNTKKPPSVKIYSRVDAHSKFVRTKNLPTVIPFVARELRDTDCRRGLRAQWRFC